MLLRNLINTFQQKIVYKFATFLIILASAFKKLRPLLWRWWYNRLAIKDQQAELLFMNYGYNNDKENLLQLDPELEKYRYPIQLYEHVINSLPLTNKSLLEVGCGRGGGISYLAKTKPLKKTIGIDLSHAAIEWCEKNQQLYNTTYLVGDANNLPLEADSMDIIINVESSHCYPSLETFLSEVHRILKPGGFFSWCDLCKAKNIHHLNQIFQRSGLTLKSNNNITSYVLNALSKISDSRNIIIKNKIPCSFQKLFGDFVALKGTTIYKKLKTGEFIYQSSVYQKPFS